MLSPLKISEETLVDCSFGDYLIEVDTHLRMLIGRDTDQAELDYASELQEEFLTPLETAWIIAKESFYKPWKPN